MQHKSSSKLTRNSIQSNSTHSLQSYRTSKSRKNSKSEKISDGNKSGEIIITIHPYAHGKMAQGLNICLNCVAISDCTPLHYQWYKDCNEIEEETSSMLILKNMKPDRLTGKTEFQYYCKVSNKFDEKQSLSATVRLAPANETTPFFAKDKVALLIANDIYDCKELKDLGSPAYDAAEMAKKLQSMDFKVILVRNLSLKEMKAVIHSFWKMLTADSYAFFFFAGHGFQNWRQTYLVPVDSSEMCLARECVCKEYVLDLMQRRKTALNVLLIDACRKPNDVPGEIPEFVCADMFNNTVYGYATTPLSSSFEPPRDTINSTFQLKGPHSFFVKLLLENICQDIEIQEVLLNVSRAWSSRLSIDKHQNPVLECSLTMPRKLCDPFLNPKFRTSLVPWTIAQEETHIQFPELKGMITLKTRDTEELYCNEVDIEAFLVFEESVTINILEININLFIEELHVFPAKNSLLKDVVSRKNEKILLFRKKIFGIQKIIGNHLEGEVLLRLASKEIKKAFSIKIKKITEIRKLMHKEFVK